PALADLGASPMTKRIDASALTSVVGTLYPSPYDVPCRPRERTKLGDAAGLSQFGVNLLRLPPGAWSSQRHWHTREVVLVTDGGEEVLRAGDAVGFPAGDTNGHCLQNRSSADARVLEIGTRVPGETAYYSHIDMVAQAEGNRTVSTRRDGTPY